MSGALFLIVGPSGAGKDTLIAGARNYLSEGYAFPRRTITRPVQSGGEDHIAANVAAFEAQERAGAFALSWRAHGVAYGIPTNIVEYLANGTHVVINVSRTVVADAKARFAPTRVILVTASPTVLRERLQARGREAPDGIDERLDRAQPVTADAVVVNDGALEPAVEAFVTALK
ncbi:MAG: phosphonate metabolism protein/1,5-bisphosphokinase (PRPP-forming) PhnN, partial [Micropepsaceae bacterium]